MAPALSVGVDTVAIGRIAGIQVRYGDKFLDRVYTEAEQAHCRGRAAELAARFAAKEAVAKALGTGMSDLKWREIEIARDPLGKPVVVLHDKAAKLAASAGLTRWAISLSHDRDMAIAFVVAMGD